MKNKKKIYLSLALLLLIINLINIFTIITITGKAVDLTSITSGTTSICINHPPTITVINNESSRHGFLYTQQITASDVESHSLIYSDNSSIFNISDSGLISFTALAEHIGNQTFLVTVADNVSGCPLNTSGYFWLNINNTLPTVISVADQSVYSNSNFALQVNASDLDNDTLTYFDNTSLFEINSSGAINFTPTSAQIGVYNISIIVTDQMPGTENISTNFSLRIVSNAPVLASQIPNQTWEENVQLTGLDLDDYFTEPLNAPLSYTAIYGSNVSISIHSTTHVVTFTPATDWYGITWAVFTANGTATTTDSNNITLTITQVSEYCGDDSCNGGETCTTCTADCGGCPSGGPGGGGGGGGGGGAAPIVKKVIEEPKEGVFCVPKRECGEWLPLSCLEVTKQTMSCLTIDSNCGIIETLHEKNCVCNPQWECTIWNPQNCPPDGTQKRICNDLNNCGKELTLLLEKSCVYVPVKGEKTPLFGKAMFQNLGKNIQEYSSIITKFMPFFFT
ncbi:MAG: hypothetical protein V1865_03285, partial [bacterium]